MTYRQQCLDVLLQEGGDVLPVQDVSQPAVLPLHCHLVAAPTSAVGHVLQQHHFVFAGTDFPNDTVVPVSLDPGLGQTLTNQEWYSRSQSSRTCFSITAVWFTLSPNILWSCEGTGDNVRHVTLSEPADLHCPDLVRYPFSAVLVDVSGC